MEQNPRLFVDMDGTLAQFRHVSALEDLYQPGYFLKLPLQQNVVDTVKLLSYSEPNLEIFILSAVLFDSRYAQHEKNAWLDQNLPEIEASHRIFTLCGDSKAFYIPGGIQKTDFLLDDYTVNLEDWKQSGGQGIKLLNGINHTRGSWAGSMLSYDHTPEQLSRDLLDITYGRLVRDERPFPGVSAAALDLQQTMIASGRNQTTCNEPEL